MARENECDGPDDAGLAKRPWRGVFFALGSVALVLGFVGIFLPILPTTPFLLVTAWCYSKSSKKFHAWLLNHRWFGKYIRDYQEGRGIPVQTKVVSIATLWATILVSIIFFIDVIYANIAMLAIAACVTAYLLWLPTCR